MSEFIIWFTGLSGSGKSTLGENLKLKLDELNKNNFILDGDNVRKGLCSDLGFSDECRVENIRRISEVAKLFVDSGQITICSFISPFRTEREFARSLVDEDKFIEVFVNCPLKECEIRDVKGLYKKARSGEIKKFTGIDSEYQVPENPEIEIKTDELTINESVDLILDYLKKGGLL